jgi:hypothetical protein
MPTILKAGNASSGYSMTPGGDGELAIKTGSGAGTDALTIDASQNAAFANDVAITGELTVGGLPVAAGPLFAATNSGTSSTSATAAKVTNISVVSYNIGSCYDSAQSRFTPTVAGFYLISANAAISGGSTLSWAGIYIYKNGVVADFAPVNFPNTNSATGVNAMNSTFLYLNGTTDYIELYARSSANSAVTSVAFTGALIRPI